MENHDNRVRHLSPQEEFALDFSNFPTSHREFSFAYKHRWPMNQVSCEMKVKFCPCLLNACSLWQMKWNEGPAVQWVHWVQFKVPIQALLFVMFQPNYLVGQNGMHYFGCSASQSVSWWSGCNLAVLPLAKQIQPVQGLIFVSHSGPRVFVPLSPSATW